MSVPTTYNGRNIETLSEAERASMRARDAARLHDMLASKKAPAVHTDATFFAKVREAGPLNDRPGVAEEYQRVAAAGGVNTVGKTYLPAIAAFPGDPEAWVSDRHDIARVCEERGWGCEGVVTVKPQPNEVPTTPGLAPDIVAGLVADRLQSAPGEAAEAAREAVVDRHTPEWAKP
jgi:hypothetical protein